VLKDLQGKGLVIHHWDTDGVCSTRLLLERLKNKNVVNKTPILGNYFLTGEELENYSPYDFIIILDMSLPQENILTLAENAQVMIFDHHLGAEIKQVFHYNPVIKGENPDEYPSASWIINQYLGNDVNLFAVLGLVGDHEQKIQNNKPIYNIIARFCQQNNLSFDDLLQMCYLIDSNYKLGNKEAVEHIPHLLMEITSANDIMNHKQLNANLTKLNKEIGTQLEQPEDEVNGTVLKKIHTPYNIISTITRKVAWESGKNAVVVNTGFFTDKDQIYMRSSKNAEPMIQWGKSQGFKCGGKKEVLGAIVPKDKTVMFVEELMKFLANEIING
jgi:single-stranded DNA-specific DHH superfamily exonuclease